MGGVCCIATKTVVKFANPDKILSNLGLKPNGIVHKFFMQRVSERMLPYMPYRDYGTFQDALETGLSYPDATITIDLPYARKLYYGIAGGGSQSGSSGFTFGSSINYTKRPHPKAGPFWDRRMMQDEGEILVREIQAFIRSRNG